MLGMYLMFEVPDSTEVAGAVKMTLPTFERVGKKFSFLFHLESMWNLCSQEIPIFISSRYKSSLAPGASLFNPSLDPFI